MRFLTPFYDGYLAALRDLVRPIRAADLPHTLEPMKALLSAMGNPQENFQSIVVAGSIGKGTTSARIASALGRSARVGLYTSPHLHVFRERFVIDNTLISHEAFIEGARVVRTAANSINADPSTFESATALALWWFAREKVEIAVLEVGLGGRFDAVNAAPHNVAVITPIELEHATMLGGSLESIAWHKAGIIPQNGYVISAAQSPIVMRVIEQESTAQNARLIVVTHEVENIRAGLLPARLESIKVGDKRVIIDGGHTPLAAEHLRDYLSQCGAGHVRVIVGMLRDKRAAETLRQLDQPNFTLVTTTVPSDRALPAHDLASVFTPSHAQIEVVENYADALAQAHTSSEDVFAVFGSFRLAAAAREAYGLLSDAELEEAHATRALFEGESYQGRLKP